MVVINHEWYGYESLVRGRGHADDCPLPHEHADDAHRVRVCKNAILILEYGPACWRLDQ